MKSLTDEQKRITITIGQGVSKCFAELVEEHLNDKDYERGTVLKMLVAVIAGFAVDLIESAHAFFSEDDPEGIGHDAQKYMADAVIQSIAQLLRRKGIVPDSIAKMLKLVEGVMLRDMAPSDDEIVH